MKKKYFKHLYLTLSLLLLLGGCGKDEEPTHDKTIYRAAMSGASARTIVNGGTAQDRKPEESCCNFTNGRPGEIRISEDKKTIYIHGWVDIDRLSDHRTRKAEKIVFCKNAGVRIDWDAEYIYRPWLQDAPLVRELIVEEGNPYLYARDGMLIQRAGAKCDPDSETLLETLIFCAPRKEGKISIPEGVQLIYDCAFLGCSRITSVSLPASLTSVGNAALGNMKSCTSIQAHKNSKTFYSRDGILYGRDESRYGNTCIFSYPAGKRDTIYDTVPKYVKNVACGAFFGADHLREVYLPSRITAIYDSAFQQCKNLQKVTVKNKKRIPRVAEDAFKDCPRLKEHVKSERY